MQSEPGTRKAVAFFDGQNLFHAAKEAFGYFHPNFDPTKLAKAICSSKGWELKQVRFYTGVPDAKDDRFWNYFWTSKLAHMRRLGVWTFSRSLRYHKKLVVLPDGKSSVYSVGLEKGIDVRIALDVVRLAHQKEYDVAVLFSQDQDMSEVATEIRGIALEQSRWIKVACAFPAGQSSRDRRGVYKTDWIPIDRAIYDTCLDPRDYRPKEMK